MAVSADAITHVTFSFSFFNMATISSSPAESQKISGKNPVKQSSQPVKEVYPAPTVIEYTTEVQDQPALQNWLQASPRGVLRVWNVSFEQAEALQLKLRNKGHKVR